MKNVIVTNEVVVLIQDYCLVYVRYISMIYIIVYHNS